MSDWISWDEAVEVVAREFPIERAEELLRAAILRGGALEVRTTDQGYTTNTPQGRYVLDDPDYAYFVGEPRAYRKIEEVDLRTLKAWLRQLTSDPTPAMVGNSPDTDHARDAESAELQTDTTELQTDTTEQSKQSVDAFTYRTGAPGRPTSAHLVKQELQRRADAGELCEKLNQEAEHLSRWLVANHPRAAPMTPKTISNNFRATYSDARKPCPK